MLQLKFSPLPVIKTKRLVLRKIKLSDAPEMFFMRSDKAVLKYIDRAPDQSIEDTRKHIRFLHALEKSNESATWAITENGKEELIGTFCFWNIKKAHYRAEIGYALHPAFQGKGIMDEVLKAALQFGFTRYKFHSVEANVNPKNKASIALLKKNGFVREAYFRENFFYNGKFLDSAIYSLITPYKY